MTKPKDKSTARHLPPEFIAPIKSGLAYRPPASEDKKRLRPERRSGIDQVPNTLATTD